MPRPRSLVEAILAGIDSQMLDTHVAIPAKVVKYDAARQLVDAQPMVKRALPGTIDGERVYEELPTIPEVPVGFSRAGGFVLSFPIQEGDFVWLVFSEVSLAEWRTTGQMGEPGDVRRHSLGYPIALPCGYPDTQPLSPVDLVARGNSLILGKDGAVEQIRIGGTDIKLGSTAIIPVALATPLLTYLGKVDDALAKIQLALAALIAIPAGSANAGASATVTTSGTAVTAETAALATAGSAIPATLVKAQ